MKTKFYTNSARPCWKCSGTIAEYEIDTETSLIDVLCYCCHSRDLFCRSNGDDLTTVLRPGFETPGWAYSGGQL
jgi:hypothetical protein